MIIPQNIYELMAELEHAGYDAFIIGGAVRDLKLGIEPHDYDIFTNATGEQILKVFPQGKVIGGEERQAKILTVVVDGVEVSQYRSNGARTETGNTLQEHQATCDFTINSIAMDRCGTKSAYTIGLKDLESQTLRFVGNAEDRIKEDPLRILRGIRFIAKYDLDVESETSDALCHNAEFMKLPKERIKEELMKILNYDKGMELLIEYKLINYIFPTFMLTIGMNGGDHHAETVDTHLLNAFNVACTITDNVNLRLAAFLHDIGKGTTQTFEIIDAKITGVSSSGKVDEDGYIDAELDFEAKKKQTHFYEHEMEGCKMMEKRLAELKFSTADIKYITTLIRLHMYVHIDNPGKKSLIKFFNKLKEAGIPIEDYIMLIYCDHQGNEKKPRIKFGDFIKGNWLYKKYQEITYSEEPMTVKDLKVGGHDVMKYGAGGIEVGYWLAVLFDYVMDGEIKNERAELLNKLKEIMK